MEKAIRKELIDHILMLEEDQQKNVLAYIKGILDESSREKKLDSGLKERLTARAIQSEKDIKEGNLYTVEEAEARLNERLGL